MEATDTFDVVIVGFDDRDEPPEARLQRAFGIEAATAQQLLSRLPATVQRAVSRVRAEYFRRALTLIGAHAEIRAQDGTRVSTEDDPIPETGAGAGPDASFAYAEPTRVSDALAFGDTSRAPSPWFEQAPGEGHAAYGPGAHEPAGPMRVANPTMREAPAPQVAGAAQAPLLRAAPTAFDAVGPLRGQTAPSSAARPDRADTERQFAAVNPAAPAGAAQVPSAPAPSLPQAGSPRAASLSSPGATVADAAGGWQWSAPAPPAAATAASAPPPAPPAQAWIASLPSGVFDPPPGHPAGHAASHALLPRDPSGVFDPPPQAPAAAPRQQAAPIAASPQALPDFGFVSVKPPASQAPAPYELAEVAARPPPRATAAAITFDSQAQADGPLGVLSPWEQPNAASMAELPRRASDRAPSRRPPRARARAGGPPPVPAAAEAAAPAAGNAPRERARRRPARAAAAQGGALPPSVPVAAPRAVAGIPDRRSTGRTLGNADTRPFWETVGEALAMPFTGAGAYWIGAITAWSVAIAFFGFLANFMFLIGAIVMFFANTSLLAFACDYYRVCAWLPLTGDDRIERGPEFDPVRILNTYIKSGLHLSLFTIVSQVPLIAWIASTLSEDGLAALPELMLHPITWLLFLLPYFYWPMGVGLTALGNDFAAIWNVPAGIRAISRAPLEYTVIVGIGVLTFVVSAIALFVFGSTLGVTGLLISGTVGFPLAISHGIQGALFGHLARARGEIFE